MAATSFSEKLFYSEKGEKDVTDGTEQCDAFARKANPQRDE